VRILVDYRPALRERTGVGEYIHHLIRAYTYAAASERDEVAVFTSSWKDRPDRAIATELRARVIDRRVPVRVLNWLWHRTEWPPIERLAGRFDVAHSAHPLLMPARHAAQVITIHDLFFLTQPDSTRDEVRRDYAALATSHARRAHAIVTSTAHGAELIVRQLGVHRDHLYICPPGQPLWRTLGWGPNVPPDGYVLFVGTLEPRKNIGVLLDAYRTLLESGRPVPPLVLAGRATPEAAGWLERIRQPPLVGRVTHRGYVAEDERERLYAGARLLVLPSLDEGFGLPVLEAMSAGVPVIAANRGALPEVLGAGGTLIDPEDVDGLAGAMEHLLQDRALAEASASRGLMRAREFSWAKTAANLRRAYVDACERKLRDDANCDRRA
jgi:glycosyltransferase involved in cell wall biosynthesis